MHYEDVEKIYVTIENEVSIQDLSRNALLELIRRYEEYYKKNKNDERVNLHTFLNYFDNADLKDDLHPDEQHILDTTCELLDYVESLLDEYDITIPDRFRDDDQEDEYEDSDIYDARLYGENYYNLEDAFKNILMNLLGYEND